MASTSTTDCTRTAAAGSRCLHGSSGSTWGIQVGGPNPNPVEFDTFEEKGSDVNLAVKLVWHAARGEFDRAIVISNDGDIAEAIRIVTQEANHPVHLRSPDINVNNVLSAAATDAIPLDTKLFKFCLFPPTVVTAAGVPIRRPKAWT